jgi:hypothetical protein
MASGVKNRSSDEQVLADGYGSRWQPALQGEETTGATNGIIVGWNINRAGGNENDRRPYMELIYG